MDNDEKIIEQLFGFRKARRGWNGAGREDFWLPKIPMFVKALEEPELMPA